MCQTIHRSKEDEKPPETPKVVVHEPDSALLETPERVSSSPELGISPSGFNNLEERERAFGSSELKTPTEIKQSKGKINDAARQQGKLPRRQPSRRQSRSSDKLNLSPSRRGGFQSLCNVYLFMPYLHFETDTNRKAMVRALETPVMPRTATELSQDEVLMRAHMSASSSFLHIRRTLGTSSKYKSSLRLMMSVLDIDCFYTNSPLDQFFYHNIDTHMRDCDQVVYRFQKKHRRPSDSDRTYHYRQKEFSKPVVAVYIFVKAVHSNAPPCIAGINPIKLSRVNLITCAFSGV